MWREVKNRRRGSSLTAFCAVLALTNAAPAFGYAVQLAWTPVSGAAGYRVYISQTMGAAGSAEDVGALAPDSDGIVRSIVQQGLVAGAVNYFAVTSYAPSGAESTPSNQLSLQIGAPAAATRTTMKLLIKDKGGDASKRKVALVSNSAGSAGAAAPGSAADPTLGGGEIVLLNPTTTESDMFTLPPARWKALGKPPGTKGYKYTDSHRVDGPCKKVLLRPGKVLNALCKGAQIAFSLNEPQQGSLDVKFSAGGGAFSSCMEFGGTNVIRDTQATNGKIGEFTARGVTPAMCPIP